MPRHCSVCQSPHLLAINQAIAAGRSLVEISRFSSTSPDSLSRHKAAHLKSTPVTVSDSSQQPTRSERLQTYLQRCDELFLRAGAANDLRGQILSLREGLRALELDLRRAGELNAVTALQNQISITQGLTLADFDRIIERAGRVRQSEVLME